jgi:hypothetical protein
MKLLPIEEFVSRFTQTAETLGLKPDLQSIGLSRKGKKIQAVVIPNMPNTGIFLGFPHPNEPLCELILEELLQEATIHQSLEKGNFWYIVPVWDIDGALENEFWWSNKDSNKEITLSKMAENWYRPAPADQVEWTFPLDYGGYHFNNILPETEAVRRLIDDVHPEILVSLHNGLFSEGYILLSEAAKELAPLLNNQLEINGISIKQISPIPYIQTFCEGVFSLPHAHLEIEYLQEINQENILSFYDNGAASFEYVNDHCVCLVLELPLFRWIFTDEPSVKILRKDLADQKLQLWQTFQKELSDAFTHQELHVTNQQLLSSPQYFFKRRDSDTAMIKNSLKDSLISKNIASESDLKSYISMLFTISTQYSQLYRGAGFKTTTSNFIRNQLKIFETKYLTPIDLNTISKSGIGIIRHALKWIEQRS